jgi:hypothetical protein
VQFPNATPEEKSAATAKLEAREKHLAPAYQSVALEFADLHDRSGRMKAKANCTPCDWENARRAIFELGGSRALLLGSGVGVLGSLLELGVLGVESSHGSLDLGLSVFVDNDSRGGVLEPEGIVEGKFWARKHHRVQ